MCTDSRGGICNVKNHFSLESFRICVCEKKSHTSGIRTRKKRSACPWENMACKSYSSFWTTHFYKPVLLNAYFEQHPPFGALSWGCKTYDDTNLSHSSVCLHMSDCKEGREAPDSDKAGSDFQGWNSWVTLTANFFIFFISILSSSIKVLGHFIWCLWSSETVALPPHLKYRAYYIIFSLAQLGWNPFTKVV